MVSRESHNTCIPVLGTRPNEGLKPTTPLKAAGRIMEPPVCVPSAKSTMPAATAAADPLEEPPGSAAAVAAGRSEEHTSELQSRPHLVCRLLLEKKKRKINKNRQ